MRSIPRTRRPGEIRILLLCCRQGSASAFRVLCLREGAQDLVDIAQNVGVHILLGQRKGLESRVGFAQDFESVLHRNDSIGSRKLVGSIKTIAVPEKNVVVHHDCLNLDWTMETACF